jgi:hypothetical protein
MTLKIIVRPVEAGFEATVLGLADCKGSASTREAALELAQQSAEAWLAECEIVAIEVSPGHLRRKHAVEEYIGIFKDDPFWDDFIAAMAEYRREVDARQDIIDGQ